MRLPSFLVLGAPKCGTTSLHFWMSARPDVFLPEAKETHFLTKFGTRGLRWYEKTHFADAPQGASSVRSRRPTSAARRRRCWPPSGCPTSGRSRSCAIRPPGPGATSGCSKRCGAATTRPPTCSVGRWSTRSTSTSRTRSTSRRDLRAPSPGMGAGGRPRGAPRAAHRGAVRRPGGDLPPRVPSHRHRPRTVPGVVGERFNETKPVRNPGSCASCSTPTRGSGCRGKLGTRIDTWNRMERVPTTARRPAKELVAFYEPHLDALESWLGRAMPESWRRTD